MQKEFENSPTQENTGNGAEIRNSGLAQGERQYGVPHGEVEGKETASTLVSGKSPRSEGGGNTKRAVTEPTSAITAESLALSLPEHFAVDERALQKYKQFCADNGFSGEQAQKAVDYYIDHQNSMHLAEREATLQALANSVWAGKFSERLARANSAVQRLDMEMGGRLLPVVEAGLGNNAVFAEMMAVVGDWISEDSVNVQSTGSSGAKYRPMSTEEYLRTEVFGE